MSSEFTSIIDIYELARITLLKKNHYKRIDDVKTRRRIDVIITAFSTTANTKNAEISAVNNSTLNKSTTSVEQTLRF